MFKNMFFSPIYTKIQAAFRTQFRASIEQQKGNPQGKQLVLVTYVYKYTI